MIAGLAWTAVVSGQALLPFALAWCAGALVQGRRSSAVQYTGVQAVADEVWRHIVRTAAGLALLAWVAALLGLFGLLRTRWVVALWGAFAVAGLLRAGRTGFPAVALARQSIAIMHAARPHQRVTALLAALAIAALVLNTMVGSVHPEAFQDSLWYHLTVPAQWALSGQLSAFPWCVPSNYALGFHSIIAANLLLGADDMVCIALCAWAGVFLILGVVVLAARQFGPRGALAVLVAWVPFYAMRAMLAPTATTNDHAAALFLLTGCATAWECVGPRSRATLANAGVAGLLLGSAVATKIVAIPVVLATMVLFTIGPRKSRVPWLIQCTAIVTAFVIIAPWGARGLAHSGLPLFPLRISWLNIAPAYAPALAASQGANRLYAWTLDGLRESISDLPVKARIALLGGDVLFLTTAFSGITALLLVHTRRHWRIALTSLSTYGLLLVLAGTQETLRYISIAYPVGSLTMAALGAELSRAKPRLYASVIAAAAIVGCGAFLNKQITFATWPTIAWNFRPLLSREARHAWLHTAEGGGLVLQGERLRVSLPHDATVLAPTVTWPYHLQRKLVWNDELVTASVRYIWTDSALSTATATAFLKAAGITHVLETQPDQLPVLKQLQAAGLVRETLQSQALRRRHPHIRERIYQVLAPASSP